MTVHPEASTHMCFLISGYKCGHNVFQENLSATSDLQEKYQTSFQEPGDSLEYMNGNYWFKLFDSSF